MPTTVFFSTDDRRLFIFTARVGTSRPDVAANSPLLQSGWSTPIPAACLRAGEVDIKIFGVKIGTVSRANVTPRVALLRSGWSTAIPAAFLPKGEFELRAWIYDRDHSRFLRLADCNGPTLISRSF